MSVTIKDYNTIINEAISYLAVNLQGKVTDFNPGSVVRTFAEAISLQIGKNSNIPDNLYQQLENTYNAAFISTSTGTDLDKLVELVGVTRIPASKAVGTVSFQAIPAPSTDILIPSGTQVSTQPDDSGGRIVYETTADVTLLALATSVDAPIRAMVAGIAGNVAALKITYLSTPIYGLTGVSNAALIGGGADKESDANLRERAKGAIEVIGNATKEALRLAVLGVAGVGSVTVDDLPMRTTSGEIHVYTTGTNLYPVYHWRIIDDVNVVISGTASAAPYTFLNGIDYNVLEDTNEIEFGIGGTDPDNGTNLSMDYTYNHFGEVDMIVAGISIPMAPSTLAAVETVIDETKAAGVQVNVIEPSVVLVSVTCAVSVLSGYNVSAVKAQVQTNLTLYLDTIAVGYDVYVADLYAIIQDTDGVENSTISLPAADVPLTAVQVARAGTITVT